MLDNPKERMQSTKSGKAVGNCKINNLEVNKQDFNTNQSSSPCNNIERITHSHDYKIENVEQRRNDAEVKERCEKTSSKEDSSSVAGAEKHNKNSFKTTQPDNTFIHDNSVTDLLESSEKLQNMLNENTMNKTSSSCDTECRQYDTENIETCPDNPNFAQLTNTNSNSFSDNQATISTKTKGGRCFTGTTKRPSATATPVAWGDSARKSIETGLASAQNAGFLLVQTSSVCVTIPWATNWNHSPVNKVRRRCAILIMNPMFDWFITSVIFLNTIVMAMEYHGMNRDVEITLDNINLVSDPTDSRKKAIFQNLRHFGRCT